MRDYAKKTLHGFEVTANGDLEILKIPSFLEEGFFKHCFTTRNGGVSEGCYNSLNLSKTRENNEENKKKNYQKICDTLGVSYGSLTIVNYAHGGDVQCVESKDAGKGISKESDLPPCDGMLTNADGVTVLTLHADCVPIFMADIKKRVVGACHAGWKGVSFDIAGKMIEKMKKNYGSDPKDILVGIGPHIMDCCFEVQYDVSGIFVNSFGNDAVVERAGKTFVNMQYAILAQLKQKGIIAENVTCANLCTSCREDLFFSHRRDNGKTGAMGSFISV